MLVRFFAYGVLMILKFGFIERWYERTKEMARHRHALRAMVTVSFFESFIFPIPTSAIFLPMVVASPHKAWRLAFICSLASVIGGIVGYLLGWLAYETIALPILENLGKAQKIKNYEGLVDQYGALAVFIGGLTPVPFKVVTVLSGALKLNFLVFLAASVLSRCMQFYFLAAVVWKFGERAEALIKKHFAVLSFGFVALCAIGWFVWKAYFHS